MHFQIRQLLFCNNLLFVIYSKKNQKVSQKYWLNLECFVCFRDEIFHSHPPNVRPTLLNLVEHLQKVKFDEINFHPQSYRDLKSKHIDLLPFSRLNYWLWQILNFL